MIRRLRQRGLGTVELTITGLAVLAGLAALVYIATVGLPTQKTEHTEKTERNVTTTQRVPMSGSRSTTRERERSVTVARTTRELGADLQRVEREIRMLGARARTGARAEVARYCERVGCSRRGPAGERGAAGQNGAPGSAGRDAPGASARTLDSAVIDAVDNRVADLERLVAVLLQRLNILEPVVRALCPLLPPARCAR